MFERARVLIVEDEMVVAEGIRDSLIDYGYDVPDVCLTAEEALRMVADIAPNVILMDIHLKGQMDGIRAAEIIHEQYDIPVVYVTAYTDEETLRRAKITAPFGYIVKPFELHDLYVTLEMALNKHRLEQRVKASEQKYRHLFENVPVGLYHVLPDGELLDVNPALVEILHYPSREALLQERLVNLYESQETYLLWQAAFSHEDVLRDFESRMCCYDGAAIWVREAVRLVREANGRPLYYEGAVTDITQQKWSEQALEQRNSEMALLNQATQKFGASLKLDEVLAEVLDSLYKLWKVGGASVWLNDASGKLECRKFIGPQPGEINSWLQMLHSGLAEWVKNRGKSMVIQDTQKDPRYAGNVLTPGGEEMRSLLCVPLRFKDKVIGALEIMDKKPRRFSYADLSLIEAIASAATAAIENAQLYTQIDQLLELTQDALDYTEALFQFSRYLNVYQEWSVLLQAIADQALKLLRADYALLLLPLAGAQVQTLVWSAKPPAELPATDGAFLRALEQWATTADSSLLLSATAPVEKAVAPMSEWCVAQSISSLAAAVLTTPAHRLGVLLVCRRAGSAPLGERETGLVRVMASQAALALEGAQTVQQVGRARDFYLTLFDKFPALIWRSGLDAKCDYFNHTWLTFTGRTLAQEMGDGWAEGVHPDDLEYCVGVYLKAFAAREPFQMEYRLRRYDGAYRWITDIGRPFYDLEHQFAGYIGSCYDITERKQASQEIAQSEEKLRRFVEHSTDGMMLLDAQGLLLDWNPSQESITGLSRAEVVGRLLWDVYLDLAIETPGDGGATESVGQLKAYLLDGLKRGRDAAQSFAAATELRVRRRDGQVRVVQGAIFPIPVADGYLYGSVMRDITEQQVYQETLRRERDFAGRLIRAALDPDELPHLIACSFLETLHAPHCLLLHFEKTSRTLTVWAQQCATAICLTGLGERYCVEDWPVLQALLETRRPRILAARAALSDAERAYLNAIRASTGVLLLPLAVGDQIVGIVQLLLREDGVAYSHEEVQLCQTLADQASIALNHVQLYEAIRQQREELRALTARLAETEESDRQWLARELHDQIGQNLTALNLNLEMMQHEALGVVADAFKTRVEDSMSLVKQMTRHVREVMAELRSPVLDAYGLLAALRWYATQFTTRTGIPVDVEGEEPSPRLVVSAENAFFRIAQEALTNVAKHAQATQAHVTLEVNVRFIRLVVADNGVGFDPEVLSQAGRRGWGLISIEERARAIGGVCRIEPLVDGGARVMVEVQR